MKILFILAFLLVGVSSNFAREYEVLSPSGNVKVVVSLKENFSPYPAGEYIYYSIYYNDKKIIKDSPFTLDFVDMPQIGKDFVITNSNTNIIHETWERVLGKSKEVLDHCNELILDLEESTELKRKISLIFRAYDDGVGFRYNIPEQQNIKVFNLASENTGFYFLENHKVWAADYKGFKSHQEEHFDLLTLNDLKKTGIYGCPILINIDNERWAAITEANLTDWAGMYLVPDKNSENALVTKLSPRIDNPEIAVKSIAPRNSPWRVILLGEEP